MQPRKKSGGPLALQEMPHLFKEETVGEFVDVVCNQGSAHEKIHRYRIEQYDSHSRKFTLVAGMNPSLNGDGSSPSRLQDICVNHLYSHGLLTFERAASVFLKEVNLHQFKEEVVGENVNIVCNQGTTHETIQRYQIENYDPKGGLKFTVRLLSGQGITSLNVCVNTLYADGLLTFERPPAIFHSNLFEYRSFKQDAVGENFSVVVMKENQQSGFAYEKIQRYCIDKYDPVSRKSQIVKLAPQGQSHSDGRVHEIDVNLLYLNGTLTFDRPPVLFHGKMAQAHSVVQDSLASRKRARELAAGAHPVMEMGGSLFMRQAKLHVFDGGTIHVALKLDALGYIVEPGLKADLQPELRVGDVVLAVGSTSLLAGTGDSVSDHRYVRAAKTKFKEALGTDVADVHIVLGNVEALRQLSADAVASALDNLIQDQTVKPLLKRPAKRMAR